MHQAILNGSHQGSHGLMWAAAHWISQHLHLVGKNEDALIHADVIHFHRLLDDVSFFDGEVELDDYMKTMD
jgi:hypothetical protein